MVGDMTTAPAAQETTMHAFATPGPITAHLNIPAGHIQVHAACSACGTCSARRSRPPS
jgi:hypothetical protein